MSVAETALVVLAVAATMAGVVAFPTVRASRALRRYKRVLEQIATRHGLEYYSGATDAARGHIDGFDVQLEIVAIGAPALRVSLWSAVPIGLHAAPKALGTRLSGSRSRDIEVGDPSFDDVVYVASDDEAGARALLTASARGALRRAVATGVTVTLGVFQLDLRERRPSVDDVEVALQVLVACARRLRPPASTSAALERVITQDPVAGVRHGTFDWLVAARPRPPEVIDLARRLMRSADIELRLRAAKLLAGSEGVRALEATLSDATLAPGARVRAAAEVLQRAGASSALMASLPLLVEALERPADAPTAATVLGGCADVTVVPMLTRVVDARREGHVEATDAIDRIKARATGTAGQLSVVDDAGALAIAEVDEVAAGVTDD